MKVSRWLLGSAMNKKEAARRSRNQIVLVVVLDGVD
jgi:hypothetical protein